MPSSEAMKACRRDLLQDALARVDQDDREVRGGCAGDHVARVLNVARRVGDDELAPRSREVAIGDVDRDALLALGAQAVGQQRQVDLAVAAAAAGLLDGGSWSSKMPFESNSRRPISVLLPSSTDPAVENRQQIHV